MNPPQRSRPQLVIPPAPLVMARSNLSPCQDCGNPISSSAASCPQCGAPGVRYRHEQAATGTPLNTIQKTSKRMKAHIAMSAIVCLVGLFWTAVDISTESETPKGSVILLVGFVWYLFTKIRVWWHHG